MAVRSLAADPLSTAHYSCALDNRLFKWNETGFVWKVQLDVSESVLLYSRVIFLFLVLVALCSQALPKFEKRESVQRIQMRF